MGDNRRVALIRQSKKREGSESPEIQNDRIGGHMDQRGQVRVATVYEIGVPGDIERDGLEEAVRMVETGQAGGIVVAFFDRLGREELGIYQTLYRLEQAGGVIEFVDSPTLDPATEAGRILIAIQAAMAKAQRMKITNNWRISRERADLAGKYIGPTPYGYKRVDGKLVPTELAQYVKAIFQMRADEKTWAEINQWLTANAPAPKQKPNGPRVAWVVPTIKGIVANVGYLGHTHRKGKIVYRDAHEALVSLTLWESAQSAKGVRSTSGESWLLSGKVKCQGCRRNARPRSSGAGHKAYACKKFHASGTCTNPAFAVASQLEDIVVAALFEWHDSVFEGLQDLVDLDALAEVVAETRTVLRQLVMAQATSRFPEEFAEGIAEAEARAVGAERDLAQAKASITSGLGVPRVFRLRDMWEELTMQERREALSGLIDCIVIEGHKGGPVSERCVILWKGQAAAFAPWPVRGQKSEMVSLPWPLEVEVGLAAAEDAQERVV